MEALPQDNNLHPPANGTTTTSSSSSSSSPPQQQLQQGESHPEDIIPPPDSKHHNTTKCESTTSNDTQHLKIDRGTSIPPVVSTNQDIVVVVEASNITTTVAPKTRLDRRRRDRKPLRVDESSFPPPPPRTTTTTTRLSKRDQRGTNRTNSSSNNNSSHRHNNYCNNDDDDDDTTKPKSQKKQKPPQKVSSRSVHSTTTTHNDHQDDDDVPTTAAVTRSTPDRYIPPLLQLLTATTTTATTTTTLSQIQQITNGLSFARPDTYPLRYWTQLLGLTHSLPPFVVSAEDSGHVAVERWQAGLSHPSSSHTSATSPPDAIYHIPPIVLTRGAASRMMTNIREEYNQLVSESSSSSSWTHLVGRRRRRLDPCYVHLWQQQGNPSRIPITAIQHAKMFHHPGSGSSSSSTTTLSSSTTPTTSTSDTSRTAETSLEEPSAPDVVESGAPLVAERRLSFPHVNKDVTLEKERYVISPQQQDVIQYVWDMAQATDRTDRRYMFLPWEVAMETYADEVAQCRSAMNLESPPNGIPTGWVAIDTTTVANTKSLSPENEVKGSTVGPVVGLVLYQLEWCAFSESIETSAEMIVHLLGIHVPTFVQDDSWLRLVLLSLVLEHARRLNVCYAIYTASTFSLEDRTFYEVYFNMVRAQHNERMMICDLHNTTVRYTFLQYQENRQRGDDLVRGASFQSAVNVDSQPRQIDALSSGKQRWLVHLPTFDEIQDCLTAPNTVQSLPNTVQRVSGEISRSESAPSKLTFSQNQNAKTRLVFSNPGSSKRGIQVALSAVLGEHEPDDLTIYQLNVEQSTLGSKVITPTYCKDPPSLHIMRNFPLPRTSVLLPTKDVSTSEGTNEPDVYPILSELMSKQQDLKDLESSLEPTLHKLLFEVVSDRLAYESPDRVAKQREEIRLLREFEELRERRIEQDLALQKQLEQDMDAVCEICLDGEVTPDNQILFCESCNVAVHQICYGIDTIPEGDYYCIPCRRLGHDKKQLSAGGQNDPAPIAICCELCPLRNGAFVRTDVPPKGTDTGDKFVHVLCAKWQGLNHTGNNKELVEDVTNIRREFRRHHVKCELCQGERGGMNKCMATTSCKKWFHVTCARAVGTMRVVHGENCHGDVDDKAWNLFCPEHSDIATKDIPDHALSTETLIRIAKEFPPEETPPPSNSQFNTLTGPERRLLLSEPLYEQALTTELLRSRFDGVRCEICDLFDDESKTWTRCVGCKVVFCRFCKLDVDEVKGSYKCASCKYVDQKRRAKEEHEVPTCCTCVQVGGLLRESFAIPYSYKFKKSAHYKGSLFTQKTWVHSICAIWLPDIELPRDVGTVDLSSIICLTNQGRNMINHRRQCFLCGHHKGLKMFCDSDDCLCTINGQREKLVVHVTCARQAGFEVRVDDERLNNNGGPLPYVRCYRHCGNEFNLRAKLEDLIEIEKKRAGKDYAKADAPMKFSDASKLLYSAIQVMRIFGWAWRWAEWWVDYNSSWEPLLEPGQNEKSMTKEELKIIESTRESRCEDARRCRLAAFGAALRNRLYDTNDGFKRTALDKALRAVLNTTSLVGPLEPAEIDFYIDWLGRAYRSKSRLLYMGAFKNPISSDSPFCVHEDGTPKFELGSRPLPGEHDLPNHVIFETKYVDVDSFLRDDVPIESEIPRLKLPQPPKNTKANSKVKPVSVKKKKSDSHLFSPSPSTRTKRDRRETQPVHIAHLPRDRKRRRSVPDQLITSPVQEPQTTNAKKGGPGRPPRLLRTKEISDSLVQVAGISAEDSLDAPADLVPGENTTVIGCISTPTTPTSLSLQKLDGDGCVEAKNEELEKGSTVLSFVKIESTIVAGEVAAATNNLPIVEEPLDALPTVNIADRSVKRSRSVPQRLGTESPKKTSDTYVSVVKKRKREPTRIFTYEPYEMTASTRKDFLGKNKELMDEDTSNRKVPIQLKQTSMKVRISENTLDMTEAKEPLIPEGSIDGEASIGLSSTAIEEPTATLLSTETPTDQAAAMENNAAAIDTDFPVNDGIGCISTPTTPTSLSLQKLDGDGCVEAKNVELEKGSTVLSFVKIESTIVAGEVAVATNNLPIVEEPTVNVADRSVKRSRSVPQRLGTESPKKTSDTYVSVVKKRKREPTRLFTYEPYEMKASTRKAFLSKNKELMDEDTSTNRKVPIQLKQTSVKVKKSENTLDMTESKEPLIPKGSIDGEASIELPSTDMKEPTATLLSTETPTDHATAMEINAAAIDTDFPVNDGTMALVPTESTTNRNNTMGISSSSSTEPVLSTTGDVQPRTPPHAKIRRPGRPRSSNKARRG